MATLEIQRRKSSQKDLHPNPNRNFIYLLAYPAHQPAVKYNHCAHTITSSYSFPLQLPSAPLAVLPLAAANVAPKHQLVPLPCPGRLEQPSSSSLPQRFRSPRPKIVAHSSYIRASAQVPVSLVRSAMRPRRRGDRGCGASRRMFRRRRFVSQGRRVHASDELPPSLRLWYSRSRFLLNINGDLPKPKSHMLTGVLVTRRRADPQPRDIALSKRRLFSGDSSPIRPTRALRRLDGLDIVVDMVLFERASQRRRNGARNPVTLMSSAQHVQEHYALVFTDRWCLRGVDQVPVTLRSVMSCARERVVHRECVYQARATSVSGTLISA